MRNKIRNGTHRVYGDTVADSLRSGKRFRCLSGGRRWPQVDNRSTEDYGGDEQLSFLLRFQISWAKISPV